MTVPTVHIHYLRLPDHEEVFHQCLVEDGERVKVTLARKLSIDPPLRVHGDVVLETGSEVVWFTFPGVWHDIGRFHTADDRFCGYYANILTPPTFHAGGVWKTTDLFLDVWLPPGGSPSVLDRDQFDEGVRRGWLSDSTRRRALQEVERILVAHGRGEWPPPVARRWTLGRARRRLEARGPRPPQSSSGSSSR